MQWKRYMENLLEKGLSLRFHLLMFTLILALSTFYLDWSPSWNASSRAAMTLALALDHSLQIDEYADFAGDKATIQGHHYSDKGPLPSLLITPVVVAVNLVYPINQLDTAHRLIFVVALGAFFFGSLPFALLVYQVFMRKWRTNVNGIPLVMLFFFGSFLFVFSGSFFGHVFAAFLLFNSLLMLEDQRPLASGVFLGLAFMTEYTMAVFGVFWCTYWLLQRKWQPMLWFFAGVLPFVFLQAYYNEYLTGSFFEFAYKYQSGFEMNAQHYGFAFPSLSALYHITISPYRGLLFYAPMLIFLLTKIRVQSFDLRTITGVVLWSSLAYIVLFSMSKSWYQGWSFGPRYLLPLPILLFYAFSSKLALSKGEVFVMFALGLLGFVHTALDKATVLYPSTDDYFPLINSITDAVINRAWSTLNVFAVFGISGLFAFAFFVLLFFAVMTLLTAMHRAELKKS